MSNSNYNLKKTVILSVIIGVIAISVCAAVAYAGAKDGNRSDVLSVYSDVSTGSEVLNPSDGQSSDTSDAPVSTVSDTSEVTSSSVTSSTESLPPEPITTPSVPSNGEKVCYLTFDDGPSNKTTPRILEVLSSYNVKATFFVVGTSRLDYLEAIKAGGHVIGLHSDTHEWNIYDSTQAYYDDLQKISDKVYEKVGIRSNIIRFPGGSSNTVSCNHCQGIMTELTKGVEQKGYIYVDWNVDSGDANGNNVAKDKLVQSVLREAKGKNGEPHDSICVLMHDTNLKSTTADALPEIIEGLKDMGYVFKGLDESAPEFHHRVNN